MNEIGREFAPPARSFTVEIGAGPAKGKLNTHNTPLSNTGRAGRQAINDPATIAFAVTCMRLRRWPNRPR
jgi:hypothetical protein